MTVPESTTIADPQPRTRCERCGTPLQQPAKDKYCTSCRHHVDLYIKTGPTVNARKPTPTIED